MRKLPALVAAVSAAALIAGCSSTTSDSSAPFPRDGATVEWVVPSAAGAGNDILARIMAPAMEAELGVPVKVVNKEGGSQVVGLNYLANAKPDGETIGFTNVPSILGRYLDPSKKAGFDRESFAPIGSFAAMGVAAGAGGGASPSCRSATSSNFTTTALLPRPSGLRRCTDSSRPASRLGSSRLTSMRMA